MVYENLLIKVRSFPDSPGVYLFKNENQKVIYIGKAKSLRKRVSSYFVKSATDRKTKDINDEAKDVEFISTNSETEALILENNLIKVHKPKLNARLKDDKTYPYLKITTSEEIPRVEIVRKRTENRDVYFGPYTDVKALRAALKKALTIFPIARCRKEIKIEKFDRSCLFFQLDRCLAPCVNKISLENYGKAVKHFIKLFEGKQQDLIIELKEEMNETSNQMNYEKAAILRDKISALEKIIQKQTIVSKDKNAEYDIIGIIVIEKTAIAQILLMRQGRIIEQKHFIMNLPFILEEFEILTSFIKQYYSKTDFIPKKILIQNEIEDENVINEWLSSKQGTEEKATILTKAKTKEQKSLINLALINAKTNLSTIEKFLKIKEERTSKGLFELKSVLNLKEIPRRIEGYDVSTLQGTNTVGSCVVFEQGEPKKKDYRKFIIKTIEGQDDFASMKEMIKRRFTGSLGNKEEKPDLILIDGGPGQISSVISVLNENLLEIPVIGLSKEFEEIHFPDNRDSLILDKRSEALKILQQIRDEAHRFAVSFHRQRRSKKMIKSSLEEIPNIRTKRINLLLEHFGSIEEIKKASIEELKKVKGIDRKIAEGIVEYYKGKWE